MVITIDIILNNKTWIETPELVEHYYVILYNISYFILLYHIISCDMDVKSTGQRKEVADSVYLHAIFCNFLVGSRHRYHEIATGEIPRDVR